MATFTDNSSVHPCAWQSQWNRPFSSSRICSRSRSVLLSGAGPWSLRCQSCFWPHWTALSSTPDLACSCHFTHLSYSLPPISVSLFLCLPNCVRQWPLVTMLLSLVWISSWRNSCHWRLDAQSGWYSRASRGQAFRLWSPLATLSHLTWIAERTAHELRCDPYSSLCLTSLPSQSAETTWSLCTSPVPWMYGLLVSSSSLCTFSYRHSSRCFLGSQQQRDEGNLNDTTILVVTWWQLRPLATKRWGVNYDANSRSILRVQQ